MAESSLRAVAVDLAKRLAKDGLPWVVWFDPEDRVYRVGMATYHDMELPDTTRHTVVLPPKSVN